MKREITEKTVEGPKLYHQQLKQNKIVDLIHHRKEPNQQVAEQINKLK